MVEWWQFGSWELRNVSGDYSSAETSRVTNSWPSKVRGRKSSCRQNRNWEQTHGGERYHGIRRILREVYWSWSVKSQVWCHGPYQFSLKINFSVSTVKGLPPSATARDPPQFHPKPHLTPGSPCQLLGTIRSLLSDGDVPSAPALDFPLAWDFLRTVLRLFLQNPFLSCSPCTGVWPAFQSKISLADCRSSPTLSFTGIPPYIFNPTYLGICPSKDMNGPK